MRAFLSGSVTVPKTNRHTRDSPKNPVDRAVPVTLSCDWLREMWYAACDLAELPRVRLHDLRHCHGQWTLDQGIADVDVQRYMGHATSYMTQRYRRRAERTRNSQASPRFWGVPLSPSLSRSRK